MKIHSRSWGGATWATSPPVGAQINRRVDNWICNSGPTRSILSTALDDGARPARRRPPPPPSSADGKSPGPPFVRWAGSVSRTSLARPTSVALRCSTRRPPLAAGSLWTSPVERGPERAGGGQSISHRRQEPREKAQLGGKDGLWHVGANQQQPPIGRRRW